MKKIKLKENPINKDAFNPLKNYLVDLGIDPLYVSSFLLKPQEEFIDNPKLLKHIFRGIALVQEAFENNKEVFIQVDSDADGYTSAAIFYSYFKQRYPNSNITYRLHKNKERGVIVDTVPETCSLVVIPDAGSSQVMEQQELLNKGKKIVIIDHHIVTDSIEHPHLAVINNQENNFPNKSLSGAGVVWLFIKLYDELIAFEQHKNLIYKNYIDLAALGILSDVMDTKLIGTHYIVYNGLKHIRNRLFQFLLEKQSYSIPNYTEPTKIEVVFYITPLINGLIRFGEQEEKEDFFAALIDNENDGYYEHQVGDRITHETLYERVSRLAGNAKSRQDSAKKKILKQLITKVEDENLNVHSILVIPLTSEESQKINASITGLVAIDLVKEYGKPVLVLRQQTDENNETYYSGSGRWQPTTNLPSFYHFLEQTDLMIFTAGHNNAFGTAISAANLPLLLEVADKQLKEGDLIDDTIYVDYFFKDVIDRNLLTTFAQHSFIYGNGIVEPQFAFSFTVDYKDMFVMGKKQDSARIKKDGVDFVIFGNEEFIQTIAKNNFSYIVCLGRPKINEWQGKKNIQVIINEYELTPVRAKSKIQERI